MIQIDVNILVFAHRPESQDHPKYRKWLEDVINAPRPFGMSDLVLSGFIRVVTHPRIYLQPSSLAEALAFAQKIRNQPGCVIVTPGTRHWEIFVDLCRNTEARGNRVPDAYLAALAIETGSEWITKDRGYARFPDLRWRHPFE